MDLFKLSSPKKRKIKEKETTTTDSPPSAHKIKKRKSFGGVVSVHHIQATPLKKSKSSDKTPNKNKENKENTIIVNSTEPKKHSSRSKGENGSNRNLAVSSLTTLHEVLNGMRSSELREAILLNLATKDLSLLKKVEDCLRDGVPEVTLCVDEKALQAQIRKHLQDDESIFYKPEKVVHKERASKYSQIIKEYSIKAKTFCKNGEVQNAMIVLRIVTEECLPSYDDVSLSINSDFKEAFQSLASSWEYVLKQWSSTNRSTSEWDKLLLLFNLAFKGLEEYGESFKKLFSSLIQFVQLAMLDNAISALQE